MNELDKLIEGHFGVKSSFATSDLLDMVTQLLEKNNLGTTELSAASDPKKLKSASGDSSGQKLLDIADISRKLIRGTESSARLQSVEDAFAILRKTNPYIDQLASTSPENFSFAIIEALNYYFSPPKEILENPCVGIGAMMTRHLILDAYLSIFEEYNSTSAGFANENFVAGLVGGQTISISAGHSSIADFQIANGAYGVSLKTADAKGKLSGSFTNMMRTLGIKFRTRYGHAHYSDNDTPVHSNGLYYLLFNKTKESHSVACFRVDREEIIERLNKLANQRNDKVVLDEGYYVLKDAPDKKFSKNITGILSTDFRWITDINHNTVGVSDLELAKNDIKLILPEVSSADDENVSKIIETITALTEFYAIFSNAVIQFATDPDYEVLAQIKKNLELAAKFEPEKLISGKC
tara:strand:- start:50 stop:1276 length:1227 start_codon:yes stop_codon:yes gene_type:complete